MRTNTAVRDTHRHVTHEGAPATRASAVDELRRTVMTCMLWEDTFYEEGVAITERLADLVGRCTDAQVVAVAEQARNQMGIRHAALWLAVMLFEQKRPAAGERALGAVLRRADEPAEVLALWFKNGRRPVPYAMRRGLTAALRTFDAYQLAKYDHARSAIRLRDLLRLIHAKPHGAAQAALWRLAVKDELPVPDTWEVAISAAGSDPDAKRETWARLVRERKLGGLALVRNLRNLQQAGVPTAEVAAAIDEAQFARMWPFQFVAAWQHAPDYAVPLEAAMLRALAGLPRLLGTTAVLVDVSGSMVGTPVSARSKMDRLHAAAGVAMAARELCDRPRIFAFGTGVSEIERPPSGFQLLNAIRQSPHYNGGTRLGEAVRTVMETGPRRLIVISDEQTSDQVTPPGRDCLAWMINVAPYQHGVSYRDGWNRVDSWSSQVLRYIAQSEGLDAREGDEQGDGA
jgi:hypothetical protein